MIFRSTTVVGVWLGLFICLQLVYGVMKVLAVALGISDVAVWPPLFGSVTEAFTFKAVLGVNNICFLHHLSSSLNPIPLPRDKIY
jgi:hypothetical protein